VSKTTKLIAAGGVRVHEHPSSLTGLQGERPVRFVLGKRVRWRRLVQWVVLTVAIPCALYLVVANVLLRTRLLRNAVSGSSVSFAVLGNSTDLQLDYTSAYSIIPGRVHVQGLTLRGRERTAEWALTIDDADVRIALVDLLHRTFHATRVRSSGFTIRARLRLDRVDATPDVVATLPPIAGFADPPLLDERPEPPPLPDATYHLWAVDLEDVDVEHVREVWIHSVRAEGDTRVRGRWFFRPKRWLDVGPATVDSNTVNFFYGSAPLASGVRGSINATVHPFDLEQANGLEVLDRISFSGQLHGRAVVADVLRLLAPRSGVRFIRWEGPFESHMVLDHGKLGDGTRVWSETTDGAIEADGLVLEAPIRTELVVDGDLATIDAHVSGLRVSRHGVQQARVATIAVAVTSRRLELAHAGGDARFTLDVGGARTNDIGAWQTYFPSTSSLVVRSGTVTADGNAGGSLVEGGGWAAGAATITVDDLSAALGPSVLAGSLAAHVDLRRGTWANLRVDLSGSDAALRAFAVRSARSGAIMLDVPSLTAVAPRLALAPSGADGHVTIDVPRAELAHLGGLGELGLLPAGLVIEDGRGRAKLHADVELGTKSLRAEGEVALRGIRARAGSTELFGDLDCAVRAQPTEGVGDSTDLSGSTLAMTHAGTGNATPLEDAWWANGALSEATLRTHGGVRLAAKVHITAKDASPATALVSQNTAVPTWAANIFRMPVLEADAEVRLAPSSFEVGSLVAHGGGSTSVRAEYADRDGRKDGAVLLNLGWIDLGYDLAYGSTGLVLFGPDAWFVHKVASLRDAAAAVRRKADTAEQLARYAAMTPALRRNEASALVAQCALEVRWCDGASIESLLRTAADPRERDTLSGMTYAPMVVAAAKAGKDGTTIDPVVVGSVAEALRIGGESALDGIPRMAGAAAESDSDTARGKVIAATGRVSSIQRDGPTSVGTLVTDAEPVHFITPFATSTASGNLARFRGVFVQRYTPAGESQGQPSLVLVGAFGPQGLDLSGPGGSP
jgi:hypothetical protein